MKWFRATSAIGALTILLASCEYGDGLTRVVVSGTVTHQGKPVEDGQIRFIPQGGTDGPLTIAPIVDGRYRCERSGGVPVGSHRVEIVGFDPNDRSPGGAGKPPRRQVVPTGFNRESSLHAKIESSSSEVVQDFHLAEP